MSEGLKFGKCRLDKRLGDGATAIVYLGTHEILDIRVAVKLLRKKLSRSRPDFAERFLREARMAARLNHPNIVRVLDCGVDRGQHYMVMDYVDGDNCLDLSRRYRKGMDWREACHIVIDAARGLEYAAENGVVHRDVKPANIMIDHDGCARITDLGLAKMTIQGAAELTGELRTVGTPNYMSPEQIRDPRSADLRADIYSLGATFYRLLCGRPPFQGKTSMEVVTQHLTEPLVPPDQVRDDLPPGLSSVVAKMMAKSADLRHQTYADVVADIEAVLSGRDVSSADFQDSALIGTQELQTVLSGLNFLKNLEIDIDDHAAGLDEGELSSQAGTSHDVELFAPEEKSGAALADDELPDEGEGAADGGGVAVEEESAADEDAVADKEESALEKGAAPPHRHRIPLALADEEESAPEEGTAPAEAEQGAQMEASDEQLFPDLDEEDSATFALPTYSPPRRTRTRAPRLLARPYVRIAVAAAILVLPVLLLLKGRGMPPQARALVGLVRAHSSGTPGLCVLIDGGEHAHVLEGLARETGLVVQGLTFRDDYLRTARRTIREGGYGGRVSAVPTTPESLPYADDLVDILVARDIATCLRKGLKPAEILRVMRPGGVAFFGLGKTDTKALQAAFGDALAAEGGFVPLEGGWVRIVKARPPAMDDWPQYRHDPARTAVSGESGEAFPTRLRWLAGEAWTADAAGPGSIAIVCAGGRTFQFVGEESAPGAERGPRIVARNAFNGIELWRRPVYAELPPPIRPYRMAADADHLYAYVEGSCKLSALDAATGEIVRTYSGIQGVAFTLADGVIVAGPGARQAYDAASGRTLWEDGVSGANPSVVVGQQVFALAPGVETKLFCLELKTGERRWWVPAAGTRLLGAADGRVFTGQTNARGTATVHAYSFDKGKRLWSRNYRQAHTEAPPDMLVIGQTGWVPTGDPRKPGAANTWTPLDVRNGRPGAGAHAPQPERTSPPIARATKDYILAGGEAFLRIANKRSVVFYGGRGAAQLGCVPANSMLYTGPVEAARPYACAALAAGSRPVFKDTKNVARASLQTGPALSSGAPASSAAQDDWPTFRHDPTRTGATTAEVGRHLHILWESRVGPGASAPTVAAGRAFVAVAGENSVAALDANSGEERWRYATSGRVDSPPTYSAGRALFGSADGWLYCVRASDGALAWRLRAAPSATQVLADGRPQSAWPVHGAVLVQDGVAYVAAGTHSALEGGIFLCAARVTTGEVLWSQPLFSGGGANLTNRILTVDDRFVRMGTWRFDPADGRGRDVPAAPGLWPGARGFLVDIARPPYGPAADAGRWTYSSAARRPGAGDVHADALCVADKTVFGIRAAEDESSVFSATGKNVNWTIPLPAGLRPKAVLSAGQVVFVAAAGGPGHPPGRMLAYAAADGKELGGVDLPTAPVFDGIAATKGHLYLTGADGTVLCLSARRSLAR